MGDYYIWLYDVDCTGIPTSFEKYEIIKTMNDDEDGTLRLMEIEMATKFCTKDVYSVHHRLTVNLPFQLDAKRDRHDWKLEKFEYKNKNNNNINNNNSHYTNNNNEEQDVNEEEEWTQFGDCTDMHKR